MEQSILGVESFKTCGHLYGSDCAVIFAVAELCRMCLAQRGHSVNLDERRERRLELCSIPGLKFFDIILGVILKQGVISSVE